MMKQYEKIKSSYRDCLLFYRMGDFYELFMEDAYIGARVLNVTLTSKRGGKDGKIPMAGVPYHAVDTYLAKLVKAGYKVAICEQVSLPSKYGLVDREVVRVVTPGTILDENSLAKKENNYIVSLDIYENILAISCADLSTGFFGVYEVPFTNLEQTLRDELAKLSPVECILPEYLYNDPEFLKLVRTEKGLNVFPFSEWDNFADNAVSFLKNHFHVATLHIFEVEDLELGLETGAVLLGYLQNTQKSRVDHIKKISRLDAQEHVVMDKSTMLNLELFSTIREHDTIGSLLHVLDQTITSMGGRLLKSWIKKPLVKKEEIEARFDATGELLKKRIARQKLEEFLSEIPDIERIVSRLSIHIGNPRDVMNLKSALARVIHIKKLLTDMESPLLEKLDRQISNDLSEVIAFVKFHIIEEPPIELHAGGIIKPNVNAELDRLRKIVGGSREWIAEMEASERAKTGISSLKVKYNKVFGFYIEVTRANLHLVPKQYSRKQTLVNGERFITDDLKRHEEIILTAEERIKALEYALFMEMLGKILTYVEVIQDAAYSVATLDCLLNFAKLAEKNNYVRPKILYSGEMKITQGRHPVVEKLLDSEQFVPNDVTLDPTSQQLLLITGPNMAGKSVFIRQVALIVLIAQLGCFVPAERAYISLVDRIFVRSGASDVITSGLSTFMVEMVETAYILHHATKNSLIVMDEIGRGTSTYDGISLAWATAEHLVTKFKNPTSPSASRGGSPKVLFATHYHELQALEEHYPNQIKNFHMTVAEERGEPIFLHTILPGGANSSFGIAVAKLAGLPEEVIKKAEQILKNLEARDVEKSVEPPKIEYQEPAMAHITNLADHLIHKELESIDISHMTPLQALNKLAELKEKMKVLSSDEIELLQSD